MEMSASMASEKWACRLWFALILDSYVRHCGGFWAAATCLIVALASAGALLVWRNK